MKDYYVTVCSSCRTASCWHGEFLCDRFRDSGTVAVLASALHKEDREHHSNFSIRKIREVCGMVQYAHRAGWEDAMYACTRSTSADDAGGVEEHW